jgi:hypothetical protein
MISLLGVFKELILEGGNVFGTTSPIKKEYIQPTLMKFTQELKKVFPKVDFKFSTLGSVGKKDESGDIDLALSVDQFMSKDGEPLLEKWGLDEGEFKALFEKIRGRAKTASETQSKLRAMLELIAAKLEETSDFITTDIKSAGGGSIYCNFNQYDERGEEVGDISVQIDINVGNLDWLTFSYYSNTYKDNVKGLHRTQLMLAMFGEVGLSFNHNRGVTDPKTKEVVATNSKEAIHALNQRYGIKITRDILDDYFELMDYIKDNLPESKLNSIFDRYLKILDSTRCDIPIDLQQYWIDNQDRLGLKGKLLPQDSNLIKYQIIQPK